MQRLEVTRQRALRPGPRNLRFSKMSKTVGNWSPNWRQWFTMKKMLNKYTPCAHLRAWSVTLSTPCEAVMNERFRWHRLRGLVSPEFHGIRFSAVWITLNFQISLNFAEKVTDPPRSMSRIAGLSSCPGLRSASWDDEVLRVHGLSKSFSFKHV